MSKIAALFVLSLVLTACASGSATTPSPTFTRLAVTPAAPSVTPTFFLPVTASPQASATFAPPTPVPATYTPLPSATAVEVSTAVNTSTVVNTPIPPTATQAAADRPTAQIPLTRDPTVPAFDHIVIILFENHDYNQVIGNAGLATFNRLAQENVLFTQFYAVAHPSLPNYLALIGGSTFGIHSDCGGCFINETSLPDLIESSGRTWKTYQESMRAPCTVGGGGGYAENHNPFVYFDPIRTDQERCQRSVVPLTQLDADLSANALPNYSFIVPNTCNTAHDCSLTVADAWLKRMVDQLESSPALGQNSMIMIVFDESSSSNAACCGLPTGGSGAGGGGAGGGGRIPAILISPLAKSGFQDDTPYSHYSLLKTILQAWNLPDLGFTANPNTLPITAPWKGQ